MKTFQTLLSEISSAIPFRDKNVGAEIVASGYPSDAQQHLDAHKGKKLIGQKVTSQHDLAPLAQAHRDPRYETFHVVYTKDDMVVGHTAITNRLPGMVRLFHDKRHQNESIGHMKEHMSNLGADSYWILHNHPSGNPRPSKEDVQLTSRMGEALPGLRGHVIVNSNKFAHIDPEGKTRVHEIDGSGTYNLGKHSLPHDVIGKPVMGVNDVVNIGKQFQKEGHATVIGRKADGTVSTVASYPEHLLQHETDLPESKREKKKLEVVARLRRFIQQTGSGGNLVISIKNHENLKKYQHLLDSGIALDVVAHNGYSLNNGGRPEIDPELIGGKLRTFGGLTD